MLEPYQYKSRINELQRFKSLTPHRDPQATRRIQMLRKKLRKSRNSIQTPDPNPKPPNQSGPSPAPSPQTGGQTPAPAQDRGTQGFSSYTPVNGAPDPRDARYWRDVSRLMFDRNQQLSQLQTEEVYGRTAYEKALENLAQRTPTELRGVKESANRGGALYSSRTGDALSSVLQGAASARGELESGFRDESSMREFMRSQIEQGMAIEEAAALAESIDRASQGEIDKPAPPGGPDLMKQLMAVLGNNNRNPRRDALRKKIRRGRKR